VKEKGVSTYNVFVMYRLDIEACVNEHSTHFREQNSP
jgi:hypothetical protein